jgi:NDP-sugar pyrophosphorylase family protein
MDSVVFSVEKFFDLSSFEHRAVFDGCSTVWQVLEHLKEYLFKQSLGAIQAACPEGVVLEHPELISIGEGTVVESGAYIRGPCIIGRNCEIRHGAYIRGNVLVGDKCVVGHTTELKHSILLNHAKAAHFAFVGDSVLGNDVNLGAGVKCANLRLDGASIVIRCGKERTPTGLRKFGAIIGDGCQIGCNVVTNPGTLVGKNVRCCPTVNIGGVIASDSHVRLPAQPLVKERVSTTPP